MSEFSNLLARSFANAGLLPDEISDRRTDELFRGEHDLLPELMQLHSDNGGNRPAKVLDKIVRAGGEELRLANARERHWLGSRVIWRSMIPRFCPRLGVLSSRLGLELDQRAEWFTALRTIVLRGVTQHAVFVTASSTSADRFVQRCVSLFGGSEVRCHPPGDRMSLEGWLMEQLRGARKRRSERAAVGISPELPAVDRLRDEIQALPLADRAIAAFSDSLFVLHIRPNGHTQAIVEHLLTSAEQLSFVFVHANERLIPRSILFSLLDRGAVGWRPIHRSEETAGCSPWLLHTEPSPAPIVDPPAIDPWRYLTHWTRRQRGPWIDQADHEFLDELILGSPAKDRSALAALARIVTEKRILAQRSRFHRDGMVSLTEVPLAEWSQHRRYRGHRNRWDFEHYGICIDRAWMEAHGARPVVYGPRHVGDALPPNERCFFQIDQSRSVRSELTIDWSSECEWRHPGHVDLSRVAPEDALVFVPTREEAQHIARISLWPVTVIGPP